MNASNQKFFMSVIGMSIEEASRVLREAGYRDIIISGRPQLITSGLHRGRVTLDVVEGKVVAATVG
jgi:hypothetical protein